MTKITRRFLLLIACVAVCVLALPAYAQTLPHPIAPLEKWKVSAPPREQSAEWNAANQSSLEWQVYLENGNVQARPWDKSKEETLFLPFSVDRSPIPFEPKITPHPSHISKRIAVAVANGFLLFVNHGEWGGRVDFFSPDGSHHYKVSDAQIAAYAQTPQGLFAVEGLAHLGINRGTFLELRRDAKNQWQAQTVVDLKEAPYALLPKGNGVFLVATRTKLLRVQVSPPAITPLVEKAFWFGMYPNSLLAAPNGDLYLGMRGGVVRAVRDRGTYRLQWLTPPKMA